ncbi:MAG TPA: M48 family peptidase, partial [Draconibacterium sp.]|nr:M48 family peptidase [Draconibacterium sp.]
MYNILFWIIIAILLLDFLFEKYLEYLNTTKWSDTIPEEVKGIYDEEKYAKQQAYSRENHRFGMWTGAFSMVVTLTMFLLFGFALVNGWVWNITTNAIV